MKIPRVYKKLSGSRVLAMEWIDGIRCTDPQVSNFMVYLYKIINELYLYDSEVA